MAVKPTLLLDIDCVLRDQVHSIINVYNKSFGTHLTREDVKHYDVTKTFGISPDWFFDEHCAECFLEAPVCKGSDVAACVLKKFFNIHIVSVQPRQHGRLMTLEWLEINHIHYDNITFVGHHDKSCSVGDIMIDDNPDNFFDTQAEKIILIDTPHNRDLTQYKNVTSQNCVKNSHGKNLKIERCSSLISFARNVRKYI